MLAEWLGELSAAKQDHTATQVKLNQRQMQLQSLNEVHSEELQARAVLEAAVADTLEVASTAVRHAEACMREVEQCCVTEIAHLKHRVGEMEVGLTEAAAEREQSKGLISTLKSKLEGERVMRADTAHYKRQEKGKLEAVCSAHAAELISIRNEVESKVGEDCRAVTGELSMVNEALQHELNQNREVSDLVRSLQIELSSKSEEHQESVMETARLRCELMREKGEGEAVWHQCELLGAQKSVLEQKVAMLSEKLRTASSSAALLVDEQLTQLQMDAKQLQHEVDGFRALAADNAVADGIEWCRASTEAWRVRLVAFYQKYNPEKVPKVDRILSKQSDGAAREKLWCELTLKYSGGGQTSVEAEGEQGEPSSVSELELSQLHKQQNYLETKYTNLFDATSQKWDSQMSTMHQKQSTADKKIVHLERQLARLLIVAQTATQRTEQLLAQLPALLAAAAEAEAQEPTQQLSRLSSNTGYINPYRNRSPHSKPQLLHLTMHGDSSVAHSASLNTNDTPLSDGGEDGEDNEGNANSTCSYQDVEAELCKLHQAHNAELLRWEAAEDELEEACSTYSNGLAHRDPHALQIESRLRSKCEQANQSAQGIGATIERRVAQLNATKKGNQHRPTEQHPISPPQKWWETVMTLQEELGSLHASHDQESALWRQKEASLLQAQQAHERETDGLNVQLADAHSALKQSQTALEEAHYDAKAESVRTSHNSGHKSDIAMRRTERAFDRIDTNKDGVITRTEWARANTIDDAKAAKNRAQELNPDIELARQELIILRRKLKFSESFVQGLQLKLRKSLKFLHELLRVNATFVNSKLTSENAAILASAQRHATKMQLELDSDGMPTTFNI